MTAAAPSLYSQLNVTGTAQLSGHLELLGYVPEVDDGFTVVTACF